MTRGSGVGVVSALIETDADVDGLSAALDLDAAFRRLGVAAGEPLPPEPAPAPEPGEAGQ